MSDFTPEQIEDITNLLLKSQTDDLTEEETTRLNEYEFRTKQLVKESLGDVIEAVKSTLPKDPSKDYLLGLFHMSKISMELIDRHSKQIIIADQYLSAYNLVAEELLQETESPLIII